MKGAQRMGGGGFKAWWDDSGERTLDVEPDASAA